MDKNVKLKVFEYCSGGGYYISNAEEYPEGGYKYLWHDGTLRDGACEQYKNEPYDIYSQGYWVTQEDAEQFLAEWEKKTNEAQA